MDSCSHANWVVVKHPPKDAVLIANESIDYGTPVKVVQCADCGQYRALPLVAQPLKLVTVQADTVRWAIKAFGAEAVMDRTERTYRFFEEAVELIQSAGMTQNEAMAMVRHVFARPAGHLSQEVAGTILTLTALAYAFNVNLDAVVIDELERVEEKIDRIREKQAEKLRPVKTDPKTATTGLPEEGDW